MNRQLLVSTVVLSLLSLVVSVFASQEPVAAPPPVLSELVVPEGTVVPIVLTVFLNSRSSQPGDRFYAETAYPVWVQQRQVLPRGSLIRGTVTEVMRPGKIKGRGRIAVRFDDVLLPNGVNRMIVAGFRGIHGPGEEKVDRTKESVEMDGEKGRDAEVIVGTTQSGAVIGGLAGRSWGAAGVGAGIGAAAGLITTLFTRGRDLVLAPGTQFELELKQPLRFALAEIDFTASQLEDAGRSNVPRSGYDRNPRTPPSGPWGRRYPTPPYIPWFSWP